MFDSSSMPTLSIGSGGTIPDWAKMQQRLISRIAAAAPEFVARYTHSDGTLRWRNSWSGMDGSDDPYEGFMYLALFHTLTGDQNALDLARKMWDTITWQWTEYGQLSREFDRYYDWMHHGEANLFHYFFGLTDPSSLKERQRAARFAAMFDGSDDTVANFDASSGLVRSPLTGSDGPRFVVTAEDLSTHRGVLDDYPPPFEDMESAPYPASRSNWSDETFFAEVIAKMNQRTTRGDVPLNLNITSLMTHAYLYSGDQRYSNWVTTYLASWQLRAEENGGIIPDNVGLSRTVGEYLDGKWWGGHYGWRWPHGFLTIIEPVLNACVNALLLTGDDAHLELVRSQLDLNFELGHVEAGKWVVPHKHLDAGWADFQTPDPAPPVHLWARTLSDEDKKRVDRIPRSENWRNAVVPREPFMTKHYIANALPWFAFVTGGNEGYPEQALRANHDLVDQQLRRMRSDEGDPDAWSNLDVIDGYIADGYNLSLQVDGYAIHAWQEFCPLYFESLIQLTLGAPAHLSHGGLQHATVRHFDADTRGPGMPPGVSIVVSDLQIDSIRVDVANQSTEARRLVIQAGGFREHLFTRVDEIDSANFVKQSRELHGPWIELELAPQSFGMLRLGMQRYTQLPTYETPWSARDDWPALITPRTAG